VNRPALATAAGLLVPAVALGFVLVGSHVLNLGQWLTWIGFIASLVSAFGWLLASAGNAGAASVGRSAFRIQWLALFSGAVFLWWILFNHKFQFQYVHDYSSRAMPRHFVYAAFWGGQEGTFLLWGLLTATLGLVLMRWNDPKRPVAMFFLNLPLVMLTLVTVMRGPFLASREAYTDGAGLNPLLQDYWMTIHPPVLFTGFSSFVVPFAIACSALVRRDYDGWIKAALPWVVFSTAIQATGFIMGGVWAYKVLGWGGYWGWDPVENGSLIPWLCNVGLLHGLLVQRVTGSLRRTNFFLAVTSYVLVLYASFLTRSGVLADFSVHSFANLGLSGFLLSFIAIAAVAGYGLLLLRLRDIPAPSEPLGTFSRESFMWLGQLVFMLMCLLVTLGMSAPLITRLFGPPANVQTSYYNLVNAPLAIAMGLLLGLSPLLRWRKHETPPQAPAVKSAMSTVGLAIGAAFLGAFLLSWMHRLDGKWAAAFGLALLLWIVTAMVLYARVAVAAAIGAVILTLVAVVLGVRDPMPAAVIFAMSFALVSNYGTTIKGFRASWKHGIAYLGHMGVSTLLIGVIASSKYGQSAQVQLPRGEARNALGYRLTFQGLQHQPDGKDQAVIAVTGPDRNFTARARFFWSEYNQGWMKNPHIERFVTKDLYISPLEMVGDDPRQAGGVWFNPGETKQLGQVKYTFEGFLPEPGNGKMKLTAMLTAETGGRTVPLKPVFEIDMASGQQTHSPDYLPGGGQVNIVSADPNTGRVQVSLPGQEQGAGDQAQVLAVEVSTKPFINLVWLGAIIMLSSAFMVVVRRSMDLSRA
jgi:cytochrome c-type biogenesis protein CcmF